MLACDLRRFKTPYSDAQPIRIAENAFRCCCNGKLGSVLTRGNRYALRVSLEWLVCSKPESKSVCHRPPMLQAIYGPCGGASLPVLCPLAARPQFRSAGASCFIPVCERGADLTPPP